MYLQNRLCHANYNCTVVLGGILTENNNSLLHIRNEYKYLYVRYAHWAVLCLVA